MKTLQTLKDEIAVELGFSDYFQIQNSDLERHEKTEYELSIYQLLLERYSEERLKEWKEEVKLKIINKWIDLQSMRQSDILKLIDSL